MLSPDKNIFLSIPDESVMLILHPAQVVACNHDVYTAVVEEDDVLLEPEQEIFLYFEISRSFMKQSARIKEVAPEDAKRLIRFTTIGNAVSSEKREVYRVPIQFRELTASIGGEKNCRLQDVSETGFSVIAYLDINIGEVTQATLRYEDEAFSGRACLQSVKQLDGKGKRYGFYCIDKQLSPGSLPRGLHLISLAVQREHLRGLERTG